MSDGLCRIVGMNGSRHQVVAPIGSIPTSWRLGRERQNRISFVPGENTIRLSNLYILKPVLFFFHRTVVWFDCVVVVRIQSVVNGNHLTSNILHGVTTVSEASFDTTIVVG